MEENAGNECPEPVINSFLSFPVVGIGASAGGIAALLCFFEHMPADCDMAFVIVLHLSSKHKSNAAEILQRTTRMPVEQVSETIAIKKNHVYVIAPSKQLCMSDGKLEITEAERPIGRHIAIDLFFRTLAEAHKERAIGIILSGTGSDGAVGISRIKLEGGITLAQLPDEAEYAGMPESAIATGVIDVVLPVVDMPQKIIELWKNAKKIVLPQGKLINQITHSTPKEDLPYAEEALKKIMMILRSRTGHDFTHYKRATVLRRLERRLQVNAIPNLESYRDYLESTPQETGLLLKDMLISVTNFFRDRENFDALERDIIPALFERAKEDAPIRVWVPGCATGEEAYSIAMLLAEHKDLTQSSSTIQVFATDIDENAMLFGRRGSYPDSIITDVSPARLRRFFTKEGHYYKVKKEIREFVLFASHNLLRDPPFSRLDLISCRNLLIYLDRDIQLKIFEMFHFALNPAGYLLLGGSESAEIATRYFSCIDKKARIHQAVTLAQSGHYIPTSVSSRKDQPASSSQSVVRNEHREVSYSETHQAMLEKFLPFSVIINRAAEIVHLLGNADGLLRYAAGEPSHNILTLIHPDLRVELRTALFQANQTGKDFDTRKVPLTKDNKNFLVNIAIRHVIEKGVLTNLLLVLFNEEEVKSVDTLLPLPSDINETFIHQLENELIRTKEYLQTNIEQYETSSEELKASNEELQAINEELRSTTEELETSKEELQSINEELITVNAELKIKVDEKSKSNDDLQNFICATEIATIFIDRNLRVNRYTPSASRLFNLISTDIGRSLLDITHRLDYPKLADDINEVLATLRTKEHEIRSHIGQWYIARLLPYRTAEDRIIGLVLSFIDITELREIQHKLQEGEKRMRLIAASTYDYAIITFESNGTITSWNTGAQRIFGYKEEEVIGQAIDLIFTPEDKRDGIPSVERRRASEAGRAEDERWHIKKDGTRFYCSGVTSLLKDNSIQGYVKIARDATENKVEEGRRQEVLLQEKIIRKQAEEAARMREEFLAVLSHELKQPLNLIQLNAELLKRLPAARQSPDIMRAAETIKNTVMSQALIIDDLLDLSRVNTGKFTLNKTCIDLAEIIKPAIEVIKQDLTEKQLSISFINEESENKIFCDRTRIEQVIGNLLSNALKFTPAGGHIEVALQSEDSFARISVTDSGRGIDPSFLPQVFEMFRQANGSTTRQHGGLGIGLALVRQLTESHGGKVSAFSEGLGKGTRFDVWLPKPQATTPEEASPSVEEHLLDDLRILLVDDAQEILDTFSAILSSYNVHLSRANTPFEALKHARSKKFDVIISDISMPEMDGYMLLQELRKLENTARIPAIALTGLGRIEDVERALEAGFTAHLSKPVDIDTLIEALTTIKQHAIN